MAKTIELHFTSNLGKVVKLSVENPIEPIDPVKVKQAMDSIVAANVFGGKQGTLVSPKEARLVEHNVTEYELI
ncbi:DUF2922 domain-containing protein [Niallia sp. Krafla_26]|uniref:DUF2922 domain-containing protein n=1 Tax=Niallia sp. Krafla_26 TaxID=3064703 RepID=UPI003D179B70